MPCRAAIRWCADAPPSAIPLRPACRAPFTAHDAFTLSLRRHRATQVITLVNKGKEANAKEGFATACACFEAAYALSARTGLLVSAANVRLKLGESTTAAAMYRFVLKEPSLLDTEREMATRKLQEAQVGTRTHLRERELVGGGGASEGGATRVMSGQRTSPAPIGA